MTTPFDLPPGAQYEWPLVAGLSERFWAKVEKTDGCWIWTAFRNPSGYGMIRNGSRMALAPRVSWAMESGPIPAGLQVLHACDKPACVNPGHLRLGTNAENMQDKVNRGRSSFPQPKKRGERHHGAKLTAEQVAEIRASGHLTGRALAQMYGVTPSTICNIRKGKVWAHER